jgi:hypothetical protein
MAETTRNVVPKQPVDIDPQFFLPPNVVDVRYSQDKDPSQYTVGDDEEGQVIDDTIGSTVGMPIPETITIISKTARTTSSGTVVDIVIEVPDYPGVKEYDVRLAKA